MAYVKGLRTIPLYSEEAFCILDSSLISVRSSRSTSNLYGYVGLVATPLTSVSRAGQDHLQCLACGVSLVSRDEQINHYKLDWHRFNLKRKTKGLAPVSEDAFEGLGGDLSSISGSDSSEIEENLTLSGVVEEVEETESEPLITSASCGSPLLTFSNGSDQCLAVYRCVLTASRHVDLDSRDVVEALRGLKSEQHWAVLMEAGGHFAGAVFKGHKVLEHKTFHRYTVRAKRGTVQSARDNQGGHCKSAGASLRRYNEAALEQDIQELLRSWSALLVLCSVVFLRSSKHNRRMFVGGKGAMFEKGDARLRTIPFATRRPTFNEVRRVHEKLAVIFEGDSLREGEESRNAEEEEGMSREGPHEGTGCKVEEDKVNVELKVEEGDVKLGGAGEECSSAQSGADKTKGRRRKKKATHTKEMSHTEKATHTEGASLTGEASHTEGASLTGEATHTEEEASLTRENTQSTEQISTDVQELMQACKVGDTQQLASLLNKMGLVSHSVQATGAMNESKEEMNEAMKVDGVPMEAIEGKEPLESVEKSVPLDLVGVAHPENDSARLEVNETKRRALLDVRHDGQTLLHIAAQHGSAGVITTLLLYGADPTIKDTTGKTPYLVAQQKGARDAFRRFVALSPGRWDLGAAQIPSPLTAEMEQEKREKAKAKKKAKKESEGKKRLLETAAASQKQTVDNLSEREKRALAAEKRLAQQVPSAPEVKRAGNCSYCECSLAGIIPFEKFASKYCSMACLQQHRLEQASKA